MSDGTLRTLLIGTAVLVTGLGGYAFGFFTGRSGVRAMEAAQDLSVPIEDVRNDRIRRDEMRRAAEEVATRQADAYAADGRFMTLDEVAPAQDELELDGMSDYFGSYWVGIVRHRQGPHGELCAVALNREPVYVGGVILRRAGRVRCSWDLATRLNRWVVRSPVTRVVGGNGGARAAAEQWFESIQVGCRRTAGDEWLRSILRGPPTDYGEMYEAACLALAGRIDQARSRLEAFSEARRSVAVNVLLSTATPIHRAEDYQSSVPVMELVLEFQPYNTYVKYQVGLGHMRLGNQEAGGALLREVLAQNLPRAWREHATELLEELDAEDP